MSYRSFTTVVLLVTPTPAVAQGEAPETAPSTVEAASFARMDATTLAELDHTEGVRLLRLNKLDAAIERLQGAVTLEPKNVIYVTDLGYAYLRKRSYPQAEALFKQAIELDPTRYHAYEHLEPSITLQPERWEKRRELLALLDRGLELTKAQDAHLRIELARIRAERAFGLIERARARLEAVLRRHSIPRTLDKPIQELKTRLDQDRQARALRDWPEPEVAEEDLLLLQQSERNVAVDRKKSLSTFGGLIAKYPAWRAPRWLRAQRLSEQGHYDEAVKDLTVLTRLAPSNPQYHRLLGSLLAQHGGLLELDRADQELRIAYALEPEWTELLALRKELAARRTDATPLGAATTAVTPRPTEVAVRAYEEAELLLETNPDDAETAIKLLEQALGESPSFIDAATTLYTLTGQVPQATVTALWNDTAGLFALYRQFTRLTKPPARQLTDEWLDRCIALGHVDARLTRALNQKSHGQPAQAELELSNYIALVSNPEEVEAVLTLRSELGALESKSHANAPAAEALEEDLLLSARWHLQQENVENALRVLDAPCTADMSLPRLLAIGLVYEHANDPRPALDCYELGFQAENVRPEDSPANNQTGALPSSGQHSNPREPPTAVTHATARGSTSNVLPTSSASNTALRTSTETRELVRRSARLMARVDPALYDHALAKRLPELVAFEPAASWALAQRALKAGNPDVAARHVSQYLAAAAPDDRFVAQAHALQAEFTQNAEVQQAGDRQRQTLLWRVAICGAIGMALVLYSFYFRGSTVARALRRRSRMFPELARIVGELRHDVFKHRTSALELLADGQTTLDNLRDTLLEPVPTSEVVTEAYMRLASLSRAQGITLRRLPREPVFGRLVRDLERAERAVSTTGDRTTLLKVDARLRGVHLERLSELLDLGPRTQLDAVELQRWISSVAAEYKTHEWTVPALHMSEPLLTFPIDKAALYQVFSNLLRNAVNAVCTVTEPRVQVGVTRVTDFTGRTMVRLVVSDNALAPLSGDDVERQDPRRGLGIVRETTRNWNGTLVVLPAGEPYCKTVGAQFSQ